MIFLVNSPVGPVMTKMSTARVISAKSTVSPTRSCDHFTCFSLGTFCRSPLDAPAAQRQPPRITLLQAPHHNMAALLISLCLGASAVKIFLQIQLRPDHVLLKVRVHFESGLNAHG